MLEVQAESIAKAEERVKATTERRRARTASANAERRRRWSVTRAEREREEERGRMEVKNKLEEKGERVRRVLEERQEELRKARLRAGRMAELREGAVRYVWKQKKILFLIYCTVVIIWYFSSFGRSLALEGGKGERSATYLHNSLPPR